MARSRSIGSIYASLSLQDKGFQSGLAKAGKQLKAFSEAGLKFAAIGAAAASAVIVSSLKSAIDAGGELQDMMAATGASGKSLLILGRAFENAGLGANNVAAGIARMQKALADAAAAGDRSNNAFSKLGLKFDTLIDADPGEALLRVGAAISALPTPTARTAAAMELFDKSGAKMLAVFTDSGAINQAKLQLGELTNTLPELAGDFDTLGDALGSFETKALQLGVGIAKGLNPNLKEMADQINRVDLTDTGIGVGGAMKFYGDIGGMIGEVWSMTIPGALTNWATDAYTGGGELTEADKTDIRTSETAKQQAAFAKDLERVTKGMKLPEEKPSAFLAAFSKFAPPKPGLPLWDMEDQLAKIFSDKANTADFSMPVFDYEARGTDSGIDSAQRDVNAYQRRGLSLDGGSNVDVKPELQKQSDYLKVISENTRKLLEKPRSLTFP